MCPKVSSQYDLQKRFSRGCRLYLPAALQVGRIFAMSPLPAKSVQQREMRETAGTEDVTGCHVLAPRWTRQGDLRHMEGSRSPMWARRKYHHFPPKFLIRDLPLGSNVPTLVSLRFGHYQAKLRQKKPGMP